MGVGDMSAYGERHSSPFGVDGFARGEIPSRSPMMITYETPQPRAARATLPGSTNKRQRLPHKELSPAELAAMEVGYLTCALSFRAGGLGGNMLYVGGLCAPVSRRWDSIRCLKH